MSYFVDFGELFPGINDLDIMSHIEEACKYCDYAFPDRWKISNLVFIFETEDEAMFFKLKYT